MSGDIKRFWEIDFLRGIAIILMIIVHFIFDLYYFGGYNVKNNIWLIFSRFTAIIFIFLVGVSLTLSYSRVKEYKSNKILFIKYLKRGLKIFSLGLVITAITFILFKQGFIIFGVLHLIGISVILAYPFLNLKYANLFIGSLLITIGLYLQKFVFDFYYFLWLGFVPHSFYSFDYFPILPWFGIVLIGIFFGNTFYTNYKRKLIIPDFSSFKLVRFFCFLGRKSLIIYLIHQPILILILYLFVL